jgi:hypothetical protein
MQKEVITSIPIDGVMTEPIPYHGAKEMGTGIANKLIRKYGI